MLNHRCQITLTTVSDSFWQNFPLSGCSIFHGILCTAGEYKLSPPSVSIFAPQKPIKGSAASKMKNKYI